MDRQLVAAFSAHLHTHFVKVARQRAFLDELQKIAHGVGIDSVEGLAAYYGYDDVETFLKEAGVFERVGKWVQPRAQSAYLGATELAHNPRLFNLTQAGLGAAGHGGSLGHLALEAAEHELPHATQALQKAAPKVKERLQAAGRKAKAGVQRAGKKVKRAVTPSPRGQLIPAGAQVASPRLAQQLRPIPRMPGLVPAMA